MANRPPPVLNSNRQQPKTALLEFMLSQEQLFTFVVRADWPEKGIHDSAPMVFKTPVSRAALKTIVRELEEMTESVSRNKMKFEDADLRAFYQLSDLVFPPSLYECIKEYQALYLVPFGELHHIPLHALKINQVEVIERFEVAYLPSASVLPYLQVAERTAPKPSLLAVGVDYTGIHRHFHVEARDVYQLEAAEGDSMWNLAESRALLGEAATRTNIINEAAAKDVIHLSTHGHFLRHDPLGSGVSLYTDNPREVAELIRGNKQTSHVEYFLSAQDIVENVRLQAELLVVNGCLTGMSEAKPGDELMGLTRGLLYAGAKSLIVSLYPFYKKVSAGPYKQHGPTKFTEFYRRWQNQGMRKSEAFRAYVRAIKAEAEYSHPFNWFSLIYIGRI